MKIFSIVGARPQFIKAAMLCRVFDKTPGVDHHLIHTGQHFDDNMSRIFFEEMNIPKPLVNLNINGGSHGQLTGMILIEMEKFLISNKPDHVVVFGDTDTTLAGALATAKLNIPLSHVEAGLRSFNRTMPEEINRVLTDDLSDLLFAPTRTAVSHLEKENKSSSAIHLSGDIMFDAALSAVQGLDSHSILGKYSLSPKEYILTTLHRANNTDDNNRLTTWLNGLNDVAQSQTVIFPIHPRTAKALSSTGKRYSDFPGIKFVDPVGYKEMAMLTKLARLVVTDSGGLQKEAYFHKVPGIILRDETEWVELVDTGWCKLVSCSREALQDTCKTFVPQTEWAADLFGEGNTANYIAEVIQRNIKRNG